MCAIDIGNIVYRAIRDRRGYVELRNLFSFGSLKDNDTKSMKGCEDVGKDGLLGMDEARDAYGIWCEEGGPSRELSP